MECPDNEHRFASSGGVRSIGVTSGTGSRTLWGLLDELRSFAERPAIIGLQKEGADVWSYRKLSDHIARLSRGLVDAGLVRGAHAVLLARNRPEWVVACLSVIQAGGVVVPLDAQLSDKTLKRVFYDSGAHFVFTTADELPRLNAVCGEMELRPILLDADPSDSRSWRHLLREGPVELVAPQPDETATLFYTSGTTGAAKGVPLTHRNLVFQLEAIEAAQLVDAKDRLLLPLPLHHVYPFVIGMLVPLAMGLPIVMPQSMTGPQLIRAIHDEGATALIGVPRLYVALCSGLYAEAESGSRMKALLFRAILALSMWLRLRFGIRAGKVLLRPVHRKIGLGLRIMASGGAPLDSTLAWKLEALGWQVAIGYGLTETSPLLTMNLPGASKLDTVGSPIPGVELRIDASALHREPVEKPSVTRKTERPAGEILARGPNVFSGYRNLPEKTAQAFTSDGWFRTGDIGFLDEDGYLHLTGRLSSMIVTEGGENIQPEDVEDAYLESPVIAEIGVLQKDGKLVAVVVPKLDRIRASDADAAEPAVREAVQLISSRLPTYQRVSEFVLTRDSLARTQLGKIRRHLLAERFNQIRAASERRTEIGPMPLEEMSDGDRAALENLAAKRVWELLASRYQDKRLTPSSSPQLDLGIDSMEWLNLTLEIRQHAGVELSEEAIARVETIRDLLREVNEAATAAPKASWLDEPETAINPKQRRWLRPQNIAMRAAACAIYGLDSVLVRMLFRLRVKGLKHLPLQQPFVLIPNHLSYLDAPLLAAALGPTWIRETYWGGWTGVMTRNPFNRLLSRLARVVPIDPDRALFSSLAFGAAVLKSGKNLVWFPEGGISRTGELQAFKLGIGILLEHFQTLAIPVAISGSDRALPPGRHLPRPGLVTIEFGQPLSPSKLERQGVGKRPADRIVSALRVHIVELQRSGAHERIVR